MKEFDKNKVFHPFNADEAEKYIGCLGWSTDFLTRFPIEIKIESPKRLARIGQDIDYPFELESEDNSAWTYFYPVEGPAQYRPYETMEEAKEARGRIIVFETEIYKTEEMITELEWTVTMGLSINNHFANVLFEKWTFDDGSPVGVRI